MDEYRPNQHHEDPLIDENMLHDFGEGVGMDMRDFSHDPNGREGMVAHFPPPSEPGPSRHSKSATPNMVGSVDDIFKAETGMDDDVDSSGDGDSFREGSKKRARPDVAGGFTFVDGNDSGRRKIRIEYIADKGRRHITFSKRKAGIMKKAYELSILTGTQVLLLVVSETGLVYTFTTPKMQPMVQRPEGKNLIQACLNSPEGYGPDGEPIQGVTATKAKNGGLAIRPHKLPPSATAAMAATAHASAMQNHNNSQSHSHSHSSLSHALPHPDQQNEDHSRPKRRLPSAKSKKHSPTQPDDIELPPVPQIPGMRPHSPHQHSQLSGQMLVSPVSGVGGYQLPPDYPQHTAYYGPSGNEGYPYYGSMNGYMVSASHEQNQNQNQNQNHTQGVQGPQGVQGTQGLQGNPLGYGDERRRMLMDQRGGMGMGM